MPFNPEFPFGDKFRADNDTQSGFLSLFSELALSDTPPRGDDLVAELQEAMTPMHLVTPEISKKLPIYGKVKQFLERFDVDVPITEESGSLVAKRLICRIWGDEEFSEDRKEAFLQFDNFRSGRSALSSAPLVQNVPITNNREVTSSPPCSDRTYSNDVAKRFSHESSKFSGESTECLTKFLESYIRTSNELDLTPEMKKKFFHHLLRDYALEFYRDNIEKKVSRFEDIVRLMEMEFCSPVKMETIARSLESMHISQFEGTGKSEESCLKELAKKIQELSPQAPADCRSDRYRKRILHNATRGREWALNVSSSSNFVNLSYQELLHELQNSIQQYTFHGRQFEESNSPYVKTSRISETNFTGQGRYMYNRKSIAKRRDGDYFKRCWNCNKQNCSVDRCPFPKNPKKIRLNRIKHFEMKRGKKLDSTVAEELFQFSEDYIVDSEREEAHESDNGITSDDEQISDSDDKTAEIQHILFENQKSHAASLNDVLDF